MITNTDIYLNQAIGDVSRLLRNFPPKQPYPKKLPATDRLVIGSRLVRSSLLKSVGQQRKLAF